MRDEQDIERAKPTTVETSGQIKLQTKFDRSKGELEITVVHAKNLVSIYEYLICLGELHVTCNYIFYHLA